MIDFELIKGKIKQYQRSSLVQNILEILNVIQKDKKERYPFWKLLVLLKWTYLHTTDFVVRKKVKAHDIDMLLKLVEEFETGYLKDGFKDHQSVRKSFRILAYQQFSYQDTFYKSIVDRQLVIYLQLKSKYDIDAEFKKLTGISIKSFFNYYYLLFIYFTKDSYDSRFNYDGILHDDLYKIFETKFPISELDKFLNLLSIKDAKEFESLHKLDNELLQLYETNFFVTKPLLYFRNQFRLPHIAILVQSIKHFVYTYMKLNSQLFSQEFGLRMERYIELGLKELTVEFVTETDLKRKYLLNKVSDFFVENDILIESKAIELTPRSAVLRSPDIISSDLKSSIVKAYCQLLSTAKVIDPSQEWFGIIITYKEMYLGFGTDAWEEFLRNPVESFIKENSLDLSILPPRNLFFIDLEYWDYLIQVVKERKTSIKKILLTGQKFNSTTNPVEGLFNMEQVLTKHFKINTLNLSYLEKAHKLIDIV